MRNNFELNCDLGEGIGNDPQLMPLLDACSIACGGHTGDQGSMEKTVKLALLSSTAIGAHPSFPDRENFGRYPMAIEPEALIASLINQVNSLQEICEKNQTSLTHIKLHGALYNLAAQNVTYAQLAMEAFAEYTEVPLFVPFQSQLHYLCVESKRLFKIEAFADRRYNSDLSLVSRDNPLAVIENPEEAKNQVAAISEKGIVTSIDNEDVSIKAETFCVHGDNDAAFDILKMLRSLKSND
ncbi:MAG: LamB/YcsF family protein [Cyclobacteriaceae bacterium]